MPLSELAVANRVVGIGSVRKALRAGRLEKLFIADDAQKTLVSGLEEEARMSGVVVERAQNMTLLGRACAISRGAAAAGIERRG